MKLKKVFIISSVSTCFLGFYPNVLVQAENVDSRIVEEEKKIDEWNIQKSNAENTLAELKSKITILMTESDDLLSQKVSLEKEVNQLTSDISVLEEKITKRNNQIEEQARSTQINQSQQGLFDVLLASDSLSDAIGRTVAYTKLISSSYEIMGDQKTDQENLSDKKANVEKKVTEITKKASQLKDKHAELESAKNKQVALSNEIIKNLENSKEKKAEYVAQKEEAEKIANEEAKIAKEAEEKERIAKEIAAAQQKKAEENQLESDALTSLSKGTGKRGTTDNSNSQVTYASGFQQPLTSFTVSSGFGVRSDPTGSAGNFHSGVDLAAPEGTPIMAARAGNVIQSGFESGAGNYVIIQHDNGYYTYYMHMVRPGISAGSVVSAGDIIGNVGTTGDSTGNHLHFGISTGIWSNYLDPTPFIGL